jgi:hypothetical protein
MIQFYSNRELSEKLGINLARWKRWSRDFLPPDPLGGLRSGYARQYAFKDLFRVYLGGYLLSHLKLSVAEAQRIVVDLTPWLNRNGFLTLKGRNESKGAPWMEMVRIYAARRDPVNLPGGIGFGFLIRRTIDTGSDASAAVWRITEIHEETPLQIEPNDRVDFMQRLDLYLISLGPLYADLIGKLHPQASKVGSGLESPGR